MRFLNQKQKLNKVYSDDILMEIDEVTRKRIQIAILQMFLDVHEVCLKNHIMVYLCGGSALGAVRHKGFIPWDDDIDIAMTRSGYKQFVKVFQDSLSHLYVLNAPNHSKKAKSRFPKIMKKGTVLREAWDTSDVENCGLFIDVFIIDNVPDEIVHRMFKGCLCNILEFIGGQVAMVESESDEWRRLNKRVGKWSYFMRHLCGKLFSFLPASRWYNIIDRLIQYHDTNSKYCTLASGLKHYFGEMLERSDIMPADKGEFEGHRVYVFRNVDAYLTNLYGENYMEIPPPENRQKHFIKELIL